MENINSELLSKCIYKTGLNYSAFAKISNVSRNTIYNISLGKTCPSYLVIEGLAKSLDITQEEFILIFFPNIKFKEGFNEDQPTK